jgi:hypothetical protein
VAAEVGRCRLCGPGRRGRCRRKRARRWPRSRPGGPGTAASRSDRFDSPIRPIRSTTRSTESNASVRIMLSSWEPPIGIEPMTYALRGGLGSSTAVQAVTSALLAWLLSPPVSMTVQGRC